MSERNNNNKLFIGNLDPRVTEYHIINLFRPFGTIVREEFAWHTHGAKKGEPRGFCFIEYSTREEASRARDKMQGKLLLGRSLSVHFADEQQQVSNLKGVVKVAQECAEKEPPLSKEAMDAKIFAIKTKLKLMEKEEPQITSTHANTKRTSTTGTRGRFEPYPKSKHHHK